MKYYPMFLKLEGKECLVVGAGDVGRRKINNLAKACPKKIVVVDPHLEKSLIKTLPSFVILEKRGFRDDDLNNKFLVVAATSNRQLNEHIGMLCMEKNILCNVVDRPDLCTFIVPSVIDKKNITITITTHGKSPALARYLKDKINELIKDEIVILAEILGKIRPYIKQMGKKSKDNREIFYSLLDERVIEAIQYDDKKKLIELLKEILELDENIIGDIINAVF